MMKYPTVKASFLSFSFQNFYPDILFLLYFFLFRSQISIFSYYYKLSILKIVLYTPHLQNAHNQNV